MGPGYIIVYKLSRKKKHLFVLHDTANKQQGVTILQICLLAFYFRMGLLSTVLSVPALSMFHCYSETNVTLNGLYFAYLSFVEEKHSGVG